MSLTTEISKLQIEVTKPTPYAFDLGLLLANDPNPLIVNTSTIEDDLINTARDGAQVLINQLLTACPILSTPDGVFLTLPKPETSLPREKVRSNIEFFIPFPLS